MATFVSLDIETSRGDINGRLIQIGLTFGLDDTFTADVGWTPAELELLGAWETAAEDIHHIPMVKVIDAFPHASSVDALLVERMTQMGFKPNRHLIAIGWNVAGFDLPFVRRDLPRFAEFVSYRSIDLNALCFLEAARQGRAFDKFKSELKARAQALMGGTPCWHDAGYDSKAAFVAWGILSNWTTRGLGRVA